ncbi:DNA-processing protein DprA [Streptococcus parauberis]|uniref:DNA protecting protein DprA n=1 Tax=Streptococcus parauberis NCFD 2020 TaxID=873447 RepID=F1Z061_9STRE|nr:DNA-processing protein DprA [Streptococcus parauberis]EGE54644.1 DNA protecting protein DprA [Streptococcus parauberis NCFD 2020]
MNNFELYKLKKAGLENHRILKIIAYQEKYDKKLSLRNMALISECKQPIIFIENYKSLDIGAIKNEFNLFPSISIFDKNYPISLKSIYNPPVLLFYQGDISLLNQPILGVVGSRQATKKGIHAVDKIIEELNSKFVIVSGLARGIDTAAHFAAIKNGGKTIAVIGSGMTKFYPKENHRLQKYIANNHLLISEYGPAEEPLAYHFPQRNRIIAGLSLGIIVCEARVRSGSLITCKYALDEGRDIFAIPGTIVNNNSEGCHQLIKEGAKCVTNGLDILSEYQ